MRCFASLSERFLASLGVVACFAVMFASAGCFSEIRSVRCTDETDCFVHENETCFEGRCRRVVSADVGHDTDDASPTLIELRGRVTDKATQAPVVGAAVCDDQFGGDSVIVDTNGDFVLLVESGAVRVSHPNYRTVLFEVESASSPIDFELESCASADCTDAPPPCF